MKKKWLAPLALGGLLGAALTPALVWFGTSLGVSSGGPGIVAPAMAQAFGGVWLAALVQSLLGGLLGGTAAVSVLPFAGEGKALAARSLLHFLATAAALVLLLAVGRWVDRPAQAGLWVCLLAVLYGVIWLGRWVGWCAELDRIREKLGLTPGPSPLKWRETLPYLPFLLVVCVLLPLALRWVDRSLADLPVLSGLLLPYVLLPVAGFCSGMSLGRRQGLCLLYPPACFVCYLPMVWLLFNSSALFHCYMIAVPALAGNALGALLRWRAAG